MGKRACATARCASKAAARPKKAKPTEEITITMRGLASVFEAQRQTQCKAEDEVKEERPRSDESPDYGPAAPPPTVAMPVQPAAVPGADDAAGAPPPENRLDDSNTSNFETDVVESVGELDSWMKAGNAMPVSEEQHTSFGHFCIAQAKKSLQEPERLTDPHLDWLTKVATTG
eukprot:9484551-Pyramimonas_sp.AAC.1